MDVGTVSSDDVIASYKRQLAEATERIAILEAALARQKRSASEQAFLTQGSSDSGLTEGED